MYNSVYNNKKVLVTGNTGFKGSWLTTWLLKLGANVCGVSIDIPTQPSIFETLKLEEKIKQKFIDIRNYKDIKNAIIEFEPDFIFHLAAQAIVSTSYIDPLKTISTNVMGTSNILDVLKTYEKECVGVIITSDKCYENVEWPWGYKETDPMGGKDIYSGSKGAAEIIFHAYQESFFTNNHKVKIATGRAGNVIGGGDWATDRLIADCIRSWTKGDQVEIRSPNATRPWQHVLEPLSGYLTLGQNLYENNNFHGEQFNFGPRSEQNRTVVEVLSELTKYWNFSNPYEAFKVTSDKPFNEAGLLKLNCDKALHYLKWEANLDFDTCIKFVGEWYSENNHDDKDMMAVTLNQITEYEEIANRENRIWTI